MTIEQISKFFKLKPSLTVAGIQKEAGIKGNALSTALQNKEELSKMNLDKLLPILIGYGYNAMPQKAKIIAIVNNKGGVGKTTTTAILGEAMARKGLKVLMIDMDSQGNLSQIFSISTESGQVADSMLDNKVPLPIQQINENLFVVASDLELQKVESVLLTAPSNQLRLKAALSTTATVGFDFILIDCPPSLGLLTMNAINASNSCLITVQPESSAVVGLNSIFDVIEDVNVYSGAAIKVEGIVFTMVKNNSVHTAFKELVRETYLNFKVFNTEIKESVDVSKAQAIRREMFVYKSNSTVGKAYEELANELLS